NILPDGLVMRRPGRPYISGPLLDDPVVLIEVLGLHYVQHGDSPIRLRRLQPSKLAGMFEDDGEGFGGLPAAVLFFEDEIERNQVAIDRLDGLAARPAGVLDGVGVHGQAMGPLRVSILAV